MQRAIPTFAEWQARIAAEEAAGIEYVPPFTLAQIEAFHEGVRLGFSEAELDAVCPLPNAA